MGAVADVADLKRVLGNHALELFEVLTQRMPQLCQNGLQLG
jgi:hypothetical protein